MKKLGIIVFVSALACGIFVAGIFSIGESATGIFPFGKTVTGSGVSEVRKINAADFNAVEVSGAFKVEITAGKDFNVEVEADDNLLPLIKVFNDGGTLKIETDGMISPKNQMLVRVSAPEIESVDTSGASKVSIDGLNSDLLSVEASGASKVSAKGIIRNLHLELSGASVIEADDLRAEGVEINASGASRANVFVSNDLKVNASGASKVYYSGNPKDLSKDVSGASCVRER